MDKFQQALSHLLPTGWAWPRDPDSTLMRTLAGVAASFSGLHDFTVSTYQQWLPHLTGQRLAEWEDATGLPDACLGTAQTNERRRQALLARLRGPELAYNDSSPSAPGAIEAVCANLGYTATVRYNTPFRVGRDRCGSRLGRLSGTLNVLVTTESTRLRVGGGHVGERLVARTLTDAQLECCLQRIVPARYQLNIVYL
jgi:uncharacterized protein YmfQ (DUF2313 family)